MNKTKGVRSLALLLCVLLAGVSFPLQAKAVYFRDVPVTAWYRQAVARLADDGIITGTSDGLFSPNDTLTRAAFVTMLARAALSATELEQYRFPGNFKDVPSSHWSIPYVNWAVETGVAEGYGN